jgi:hypothetical protein
MEQETHSNKGTEEADALDFDGDTLGGDMVDDDYDADPVDEVEDIDTEVEDSADVADDDGATDDEEVSTEEGEAESDFITIDGEKYSLDDLSTEQLKKMATHYNQVSHFQKIAEERDAAIAERERQIQELKDQNRQVMDEWTAHQMQREQERLQREQQQLEQQQPQRPSTDQLTTAFKPYLDKLAEEGRLTVDEVDEHSGLISEYLYDTYTRDTRTGEQFKLLQQRLEQLENFVSPAIQKWDEKSAVEHDAAVQAEVASMEGYEDLADPKNWERLKNYVGQKILNSPKDKEGNPLFDPLFDAETMAEQFDAMQGKLLRKALGKKKQNAGEQQNADRRRAGGSASQGGGAPPKKRGKKGPPTPEEDALDFTDKRRATA